jgi:hypothetical protein
MTLYVILLYCIWDIMVITLIPSQPVTFVVNELGEYLDPDSTYYSNKKFALGTELGPGNHHTTTTHSCLDEGDTIAPALR